MIYYSGLCLLVLCCRNSYSPLTDEKVEIANDLEDEEQPNMYGDDGDFDKLEKGAHRFPPGGSLAMTESRLSIKMYPIFNGDTPVTNPVLSAAANVVPELDLSKPFDARKRWPDCISIGQIWNQGKCGTCWAVAAAAVLTDRLCIARGAKSTVYISANQAAGCTYPVNAADPKLNCNKGGYPEDVFERVRDFGIQTGGVFGSHIGCKPYQVSAKNVPTDLLNKLVNHKTITCAEECRGPKKRKFARETISIHDFWYKSGWLMVGEQKRKIWTDFIKKEITENGPVTARISMLDDLDDWDFVKQGAYIKGPNSKETESTTGFPKFPHAIRIIGWNKDQFGNDYWLVANSWGKSWGVDGVGWIKMGEVGIDSDIAVPVIYNAAVPINNCQTSTFTAGERQVSQAVPVDARDPTAPFYLFQGECVQEIASIKNELVTVGAALPTQWVFENAPTGNIVKYNLILDDKSPESKHVIWLYNDQNDKKGCRRIADNKFKCQAGVAPADGGEKARASYFDKSNTLHTASYNVKDNHAYLTNMVCGLKCQSATPFPLDELLALGLVSALLHIDATKLAVFSNGAQGVKSAYVAYPSGAGTDKFQLLKAFDGNGIIDGHVPSIYVQ